MSARSNEQHVMEMEDGPARLEGELGAAAQAQARAHLATCAPCREALARWRGVQAALAAYAPPPDPPGAGADFWLRLEPKLPARAPEASDAAPCLAPVALALSCLQWQAIAVILAVVTLAARSAVVPSAWRQAAAAAPSFLLEIAAALSWRGTCLVAAGSWLGRAVPPGWGATLGTLAAAAGSWWILTVLAGLYTAWIVLWLRRPRPIEEAGGA